MGPTGDIFTSLLVLSVFYNFGDLQSTDNNRKPKPCENYRSDGCISPMLKDNPIWCPYNYQLLHWNGWFRICRPVACVEAPIVYFHQATMTPFTCEIPSDICVEHFGTHFNKLCTKFKWHSSKFKTCSKDLLNRNQYTLDYQGSLKSHVNGETIRLTDYFLDEDNNVRICADDTSAESTSATLPDVIPSCIPLSDAKNVAQLKFINNLIEKGHSVLASNSANTTVCVKTSTEMSSCQTDLLLDADDFQLIDDNRNLIFHKTMKVYPFGDYAVGYNHDKALICVNETTLSRKIELKEALYGSVSALSTVSLLLVLLMYIVLPDLHYHTTAFICLLLSSLVAHTALVVKNFSPFEYGINNVIVFSVLYISISSIHLWSNIMSLEVCRSISNNHQKIEKKTKPCNKVRKLR